MKIWLLKKLGIWDFVWRQFCDEYPVRLSGKSPEVKHYLSENEKVIADAMIYGMGAVKHVPIEEIIVDRKILYVRNEKPQPVREFPGWDKVKYKEEFNPFLEDKVK